MVIDVRSSYVTPEFLAAGFKKYVISNLIYFEIELKLTEAVNKCDVVITGNRIFEVRYFCKIFCRSPSPKSLYGSLI